MLPILLVLSASLALKIFDPTAAFWMAVATGLFMDRDFVAFCEQVFPSRALTCKA